MALVWEAGTGPRPVSGLAELLTGGREAGQSGVGPLDGSGPADVPAALAALSPAARALLEHVDAAGGGGRTESARPGVHPDDASTPAEQLLSLRLLVPRGDGLVVVPGEVALAMRGGHTTRERVDLPPDIATTERSPALVARTAGGAAHEAVRRVELLLDRWGVAPPAALRSGGLAVRDLKAAATLLQVDEPTAALLVETAYAAGLLARGTDREGVEHWLPTEAYDAWSARTVGERWLELAAAWSASPRMPALVGSKDAAGKTTNALTPELSSGLQVESRRMAVAALAELSPGATLAAGTGLPSLVARVSWQRPRRPRIRVDQVGWAIAEAEVLGITALGASTEHGAALLAGEPAEALRILEELLPAPVDHLLLQADLTAVAPGPLAVEIAHAVHLLADVESRGGATVYRFTRDSVRRAFDAGWSAAEVHEFVAKVSRTPVPQPLTYLVDDVARTFGTVRVGLAECFLRADDETALTELVHHPRSASWGLRRLAPTVLVSTTPIDVLLPRLRELGLAPVVEAADGTVQVARPDLHRARSRGRRTGAVGGRAVGGRAATREESAVSAAVAAIRAGDRAAEAGPRSAETTPAEALAWLRDAVESRRPVLIGYVDNHGQVSTRIVDPLQVEGGRLTAYDHRLEDTRSFAVHRITSVAPVRDDG